MLHGALVLSLFSLLSTSASDNAAPAAAQAQLAPEPATEAEPVRRATPAELRRLVGRVDFLRGRFTREALGMSLDIPRDQHMLAGPDARKADTALRGEIDPNLIGWMIAVDKTLTDANLRVVRLRWRHDGLVEPNPAPFDPAALLNASRSHPLVPRIFGSGGTLLRYIVPPVREGSTVVWSEERQPIDATKASVCDCHALHLARKGVLELSIAGVDAKAANSCTEELRALAATVHFDASEDYPAQPGGEPLAPYSLGALIAQTE